MSKIVQRISGISVLLLGIISVALVALIYFGGSTDSPLMVGEESLAVPKFTDTLLYWSYFLLFLTLGLTLVFTLIGFVKKLIESPVKALKTLIPIVIFILVFVVGWLVGSDDKVTILGYEGTGNQGFWAHFTDMIIFAAYALFVAVALTIIGSGIYKKLK